MYVQSKKEGLAVEAARGLAWMDGHVGKDGTFNISVVGKYEQVKAARAKRKELIDAGLVSALDFENDEIAEVFGPGNRRTGLLGYSPLVLKKQALYASVATVVMAANITPTSNVLRTDHMDETLLQKHTELITNLLFPNDKHNLFFLFFCSLYFQVSNASRLGFLLD
ncbi:hypothetical protein MKW98_010740 [Papaver atlanticum]|uniref:Uncharacterized protein n=1 Tax=Papaver atlanticum TaxID=357466 RepID=A0AAD4TKL6_9MAGN|nr:hypothetical protein MKW98_010740 [Papaver atlanticum]